MGDTTANAPKVSIGMPVYNGASLIRDALDTLLLQTFTDFELIISDNASIDATESICRDYAAKDARIRYIRQPENRGAWANFTFVLDEAVGQYFMWAAHDDTRDLDFVEKLVAQMDFDRNAGDAYGNEVVAISGISLIVNERVVVRYTPNTGSVPKVSTKTFIFDFFGGKRLGASIFYGLWRRDSLLEVFHHLAHHGKVDLNEKLPVMLGFILGRIIVNPSVMLSKSHNRRSGTDVRLGGSLTNFQYIKSLFEDWNASRIVTLSFDGNSHRKRVVQVGLIFFMVRKAITRLVIHPLIHFLQGVRKRC